MGVKNGTPLLLSSPSSRPSCVEVRNCANKRVHYIKTQAFVDYAVVATSCTTLIVVYSVAPQCPQILPADRTVPSRSLTMNLTGGFPVLMTTSIPNYSIVELVYSVLLYVKQLLI